MKESSNVRNLPIFKNDHFDLSKVGDSLDNFRKGEKGLFNVLKFAFFAGVAYFGVVYVLPPVFQAIGRVLAVGGTIAAIILLALLAPVVFKGLRRFARFAHKSVIRHNPFGELYDQEGKMMENKDRFNKSRGTIEKLQRDAESSSVESEKNSKSLQNKILSLQGEVSQMRVQLEGKLKSNPNYKSEDEYIHLISELNKKAAEATRIQHQFEQEKDFVRKYGMRANSLKKFLHKLIMVDTALEIKIADFQATIKILKKDYDFAKEAKAATDAAKEAMFFDKTWELEYAIDVVTTSIAQDLAQTASNLNNIDRLTANYNLDSESIFEELDQLALQIGDGSLEVPTAKQYANPDYIPTQADRAADNSGFGQIY